MDRNILTLVTSSHIDFEWMMNTDALKILSSALLENVYFPVTTIHQSDDEKW